MKYNKLKTFIKRLLICLAIIVIAWFSFTVYEYYRVRTDRSPLICFNEEKANENDNEYSITCYGLLYKYREYYYKEDNNISAREFTLFFKEFVREVAINETK